MVEIYYTYDAVSSEDFIRNILTRYYRIKDPVICKSLNGKPYIPGRTVHFNLTHSKGLTALAVTKKRVGLDCERLDGKPRPAVLQRFTAREKGEISTSADFYVHWTARESYIKYYGEALAALWRKVEFYGGKIYRSGKEEEVKITQVQLAKYSDVSLGSLKRFERTGEISLTSLVKIAFALGCEDDFESLFARKGYASIEEVINEGK